MLLWGLSLSHFERQSKMSVQAKTLKLFDHAKTTSCILFTCKQMVRYYPIDDILIGCLLRYGMLGTLRKTVIIRIMMSKLLILESGN